MSQVFRITAVVAVASLLATAVFAANRTFTAALSGDQQVPAVTTSAIGQAKFDLNDAGTELSYQISVNGIKDVKAVHLCLAPRGQSGPAVAELLASLIQGEVSGHLTAGTIVPGDLRGPLKDKPLSALIAEIDAGKVYVSVDTVDFPNGQIRGQIK